MLRKDSQCCDDRDPDPDSMPYIRKQGVVAKIRGQTEVDVDGHREQSEQTIASLSDKPEQFNDIHQHEHVIYNTKLISILLN